MATPGWTLTLWAVGSAKYSNSDSIEKDGSNIWVGYQNVTAKDGSDGKTSTIVEYTMSGTVVKTWTVPGHTDGLRIDPATHRAWVTSNEDGNPALNLTDPDSFTTDPSGNLVLVSQADSALITISNPGTANQAVTETPIGNQEEDTVWATANSGTLFVTDAGKNAVDTIKWSGPKGTVFTEAPNASGVVGFIGTIDLKAGFITPVSTGWTKPTGLLFVPAS